MRSFMMIASCVLALGACKSKSKAERAVSDLEGFRDRMCACKDKDAAARDACGQDVLHDYSAWVHDKMKDDSNDTDEERPSKELRDREAKASAELGACDDVVSGRKSKK
jgi:hypothetical protein